MKPSRTLIVLLSVIAVGVVAIAAALVLLLTGGDDTDTRAESSPAPSAYSNAEWHWAEGWCADSLGGVDGVELWDEGRPEGFAECVQAQLPAAAGGIAAARSGDESPEALTPIETYCIYSEPPAIANDPDLSDAALDDCVHEVFGVKSY